MILPSLQTLGGTPNWQAAYLNALICQALYAQSVTSLNQIVQLLGEGAVLAGYAIDPQSSIPDYAVITQGTNALVVLDGTTNLAQNLQHFRGAVLPYDDPDVITVLGTECTGNLNFIGSTLAIQADILRLCAPARNGQVRIAGHSFGAACAFVLARHMVAMMPPWNVQLQTFGEPRTYVETPVRNEVDQHNRIIAVADRNEGYSQVGVDPVTLVPAGFISTGRLGLVWKFLRKWLGIFFGHHGTPILLRGNGQWSIGKDALATAIPGLPLLDWSLVLSNAPGLYLHNMATSYLPSCRLAWIGQPGDNWYYLLEPIYQYLANNVPVPPNFLGPPVQAATINTAYMDPSNTPVTDAERPLWQVVQAAGYFAAPTTPAGSVIGMSRFKGTMEFNTVQGGFSESVYSCYDGETQQSMYQKMLLVLAARCGLSITSGNASAYNPIVPQVVRIEDENTSRDAFSVSQVINLGPGGVPLPIPSYQTIANGPAQFATLQASNLDLELGARVTYYGGNSRQSASICHHGFPAQASVNPSNGAVATGAIFLREIIPTPQWLAAIRNYVSVLATCGLGFRTITGVWNNPDGSPGAYSSPSGWYYNIGQQMIELQWNAAQVFPAWPSSPNQLAQQVPGLVVGPPATSSNWPMAGNSLSLPLVNTKVRVQVRGWKGFQVLNGRWSAQVVPPQAGYLFALRIIRTVRMPTVAPTVLPFLSPIAWSYWFPGQFLTPPSAPAPTAVQNQPGNPNSINLAGILDFVESKKLGRNFEQQRGRARNRPT